MNSPQLDNALYLARRGVPVFPVKEYEKPPACKHGVKEATTDEKQIVSWFTQNPNYNYGVACGNGLVVVDIDVSEDKNGFGELAKLGDMPPTVVVDTPTGGRHYYFRAGDEMPPNKNGLRPGIDIRGDGYYVVGAASIHPNGGRYAYADGFEPWNTELAEYPGFMRVEPKKPVVANDTPAVLTQSTQSASVVFHRASAYADSIPPAIDTEHGGPGDGHERALWFFQCMCNGWCLPDHEVRELALRFNNRCIRPWDLGDPKDAREFWRKMDQAKANPIAKHSRGWLRDDPKYNPSVVPVTFDLKSFALEQPTNGDGTYANELSDETDVDVVLASDYLTQEPPPVDTIMPGLLDRGDKFFVVGQSKLGKSFFVLLMALCLAAGRLFLGWKPSRQQRVLMIQFELKPANYHRRVRCVAKACGIAAEELGDRLHILNLRGRPLSLNGIKVEDYDMVFIDPFYKLADRSGSDENSAKDAAKLLGGLDAITERGPAVGVIDHGTKGRLGDKQAIDRASGSGVIARDFDGMVTLAPHADHSGDWLVLETILRNYPSPEAKTLEFRDCVFKVREDVPPQVQTSQTVNRAKQSGPTPDEIANTVIATAWITGPMKTAELIERTKKEFSVGEKKAAAVIRNLEGRGFQRSKSNTYPAYSIISPPGAPPTQGVLDFEQQTPQTPQTE